MWNFRSGTALAVEQDKFIDIYRAGKTITPEQLAGLEGNLWVKTASKLAPGNLVIRQWVLIDLFKGVPSYASRITDMVDLLSYETMSGFRLWAESWSYFGYTMAILGEWIKKYEAQANTLNIYIDRIKEGFVKTSYLRNGVWYPAPYGDLRDEPLSEDLQVMHNLESITVGQITMTVDGSKIKYEVKGKPIGCNTHIPKEDSSTSIINGRPLSFVFYQGYDKKYRNSWEEFLDTYDIKRLRTIPW